LVIDKASKQIICVAIGKGRRHDYHLFKQSKTRIPDKVITLVDSGYQGIKKVHQNSHHPKRGSKKNPLTEREKQINKSINSERVIVEHIIRSIKIFRIVGDKYRNRRKRFAMRINLIAAIYNYEL
jgi:hypothetical protein